MTTEPDTDPSGVDGVIVDGLPVPAAPAAAPAAWTSAPLALPVPAPVVRAAALAATSFVAGAATLAVVHRRRARVGRRRLGRGRKGGIGEIVASNSFLVDVHLIRR